MFKILMDNNDEILELEHDFSCTEAVAKAIATIIQNIIHSEYSSPKYNSTFIREQEREIVNIAKEMID